MGTFVLEKIMWSIETIKKLNKISIPTYYFALIPGLTDKKFIPTRSTPKATGWDVRSTENFTIKAGQYVKIPLGIRGFCPDGWWYEIKPRSSSFTKKNLHALYGTIDEDYEGQLVFAAQYLPEFEFETDVESYVPNSIYPTNTLNYQAKTTITSPNLVINAGEAIAQIIPIKRQEMNIKELTNEELDAKYADRNGQRGTGGFGSTGV